MFYTSASTDVKSPKPPPSIADVMAIDNDAYN